MALCSRWRETLQRRYPIENRRELAERLQPGQVGEDRVEMVMRRALGDQLEGVEDRAAALHGRDQQRIKPGLLVRREARQYLAEDLAVDERADTAHQPVEGRERRHFGALAHERIDRDVDEIG